MEFHIEGGRLVIAIDSDEQGFLRKEFNENDDFQSDDFLWDFLEPLIVNSELEWVDSSETGDLTSAPMLAIRDFDGDKITDRWAFMDYQIESVQERLMNEGLAVFIGGNT